MDGGGIDVWAGVQEASKEDLMKRETEIKILIGCTEAENRAKDTQEDGVYEGKPHPQAAGIKRNFGGGYCVRWGSEDCGGDDAARCRLAISE
jgi:hypothetical protein